MTEIEKLLERVKGLGGPDREIDAEIDAALFGGFPSHLCHDGTRRSYGAGFIHNVDDGTNLTQGGRNAEPTTSSIDAALALTERVMPGVMFNIHSHSGDGSLWQVMLTGDKFCMAELAPTLPLAILTTLLTALQDQRHEQ